MDHSQKSIIDSFEENELNVGILYKLYAQKIPGHRDFWLQLSMEEARHGADIRAAYRKKAGLLFKENKFTLGVLKYVMDFVKEKIQEARQKKISHFEALSTALRVEQSILEKKCFEIFTPVDQRLQTVLDRLNRETESHVEILRQEFKKQK